jgi:hypothetical protein
MELNVHKEVAAMQRMGSKALRARYAEVFGETTVAHNKTWLIRRIAWRLQALAEGDLSERARHRAEELANDADLRLNPPRPKPGDAAPKAAPADLPPVDEAPTAPAAEGQGAAASPARSRDFVGESSGSPWPRPSSCCPRR